MSSSFFFNRAFGRKIYYIAKYCYLNIKYWMQVIMKNEYIDYLCFPFDINTPMPKSAVEVMKNGCQILKNLNIEFCLADGTLLGIYRDGRLIPHDTDIDVTVLHPINTLDIERQFKKHGFKIGRKVTVLGEVQQLVFYSPDNVLFDIIFYSRIGDDVFAFCEKDFYFKHKANHYEKFESYSFSNYIFYIPQYTDVWLEHVYGMNWKTPRSSKPNNWREGENEYLTAVPFKGTVSKLIDTIKDNV